MPQPVFFICFYFCLPTLPDYVSFPNPTKIYVTSYITQGVYGNHNVVILRLFTTQPNGERYALYEVHCVLLGWFDNNILDILVILFLFYSAKEVAYSEKSVPHL